MAVGEARLGSGAAAGRRCHRGPTLVCGSQLRPPLGPPPTFALETRPSTASLLPTSPQSSRLRAGPPPEATPCRRPLIWEMDQALHDLPSFAGKSYRGIDCRLDSAVFAPAWGCPRARTDVTQECCQQCRTKHTIHQNVAIWHLPIMLWIAMGFRLWTISSSAGCPAPGNFVRWPSFSSASQNQAVAEEFAKGDSGPRLPLWLSQVLHQLGRGGSVNLACRNAGAGKAHTSVPSFERSSIYGGLSLWITYPEKFPSWPTVLYPLSRKVSSWDLFPSLAYIDLSENVFSLLFFC